MTRPPYTLETLDDNAIRTALSAGLIDQDTADAASSLSALWSRGSRRAARQQIVDALNAAVPASAVVRGATYSRASPGSWLATASSSRAIPFQLEAVAPSLRIASL